LTHWEDQKSVVDSCQKQSFTQELSPSLNVMPSFDL
jgi:hypothetical protein